MISRLRKIFIFSFAFSLFFGVSVAGHGGECRDLLLKNLAENIYDSVGSNDGVIISSDGLIEFFTKNINVCREYLLARTDEEDISIVEPELTVDIRWDYILEEVAAALSISSGQRNMFVCENNRAFQVGIDGALWAGTIVAAVFSFGTGGVAIQGAKVGIQQGAKNLVKIGVKKGVKTAAVEATAARLGADIAGKTAAKTAAETAARTVATDLAAKEATALAAKTAAETAARTALGQFNRNAAVVSAKASLRTAGNKRVSQAMVETELRAVLANQTSTAAAKAEAQTALDLLARNQAAIAARKSAQATYRTALAETATGNATAAANVAAAEAALLAETATASRALASAMTKFTISTPLAVAGGIASVYSFLESGFNPQIMNCVRTRKDSGCYLSCTKDMLGTPMDDLNTKVFKPLFGKNLCVDEDSNYALREIQSGLPVPGDIFVIQNEKLWEKAKQTIANDVKDKGKCDWAANDVDMYVGAPLYEASTLEQKPGGTSLLIDGIRIDD